MSCNRKYCSNPPIPKGKYCEFHRPNKKICKELNCKSLARSSGLCSLHGGGKKCKEPMCKTLAVGKTDYCISHGGGKRCKEIGCDSGSIGKTDYCKKHGGGKRCKENGCNISVQGATDYCISHGGGKRCKEIGCKFSAQDKTDYCISHGGGKRCKEIECILSAIGTTDYCISHGGGKRCPNCVDWIDSRCGNKKYDGYCSICFKRLFPEDPRSIIMHTNTKEIRVQHAIQQHSELKGFIHDRPIYTGNCDCTHRRRVDHRKLIGNTILAIETDEFAHKGYDEKDEEIRYDDLYMIHSGKWIYIRFNPDNINHQNINLDERIKVLIQTILIQIQRIEKEENIELVEIIKLYY